MKILVTGAKGFIGKNLVASIKNLQTKEIQGHVHRTIHEIYEYDIDTEASLLDYYCQEADFVFHLAGVNRPENQKEFIDGNVSFTFDLLDLLKKHQNHCPIMMASSIQASLIGRYCDSDYGKSKLEAEKLLFSYGQETGVKIYIYRFPNLFGKWCRPNYNSVVATFCHNFANDLPIVVHEEGTELELLYIDDLVSEMLRILEQKEHRCEYQGVEAVASKQGRYCYVPRAHKVTLGELVRMLKSFQQQPISLLMPELAEQSLVKKLYSTYLSYLPMEKAKFALKMNCDDRGSFTELLKTETCGQLSVNVSKPGVTKGQHWHQSKWEIFIVVSGHGLIQERKIGVDEEGKPYPVLNFEVSGDRIEAVYMLPGYAHNLINLSETENLVTVMWANEKFDVDAPDTFFEMVK